VDACRLPSGCVSEPVDSADDLVKQSPLCAGQPVPAKVGQQFAQGCSLIDQGSGATSPKKARKAFGKAARTLGKSARLVTKAAKRKQGAISADCAASLGGVLGSARGQAERLKSGL